MEYTGDKFGQSDVDKLAEFEQRADPANKEQGELLNELRGQVKKLQELQKNEDPRVSFSTPEFKEAQRMFSDGFKKNFGRPVEWAVVKEFPWSAGQLQKLKTPVDVQGNPWPLDEEGKPVV